MQLNYTSTYIKILIFYPGFFLNFKFLKGRYVIYVHAFNCLLFVTFF